MQCDSHDLQETIGYWRALCDLRFCKGGCPAKHLMTVEHETALSNWECSMIEKYWMYVFRKILKGEECFGWKVEPINTIEEISGYGVLKLVRIDGDNDVY